MWFWGIKMSLKVSYIFMVTVLKDFNFPQCVSRNAAVFGAEGDFLNCHQLVGTWWGQVDSFHHHPVDTFTNFAQYFVATWRVIIHAESLLIQLIRSTFFHSNIHQWTQVGKNRGKNGKEPGTYSLAKWRPFSCLCYYCWVSMEIVCFTASPEKHKFSLRRPFRRKGAFFQQGKH